MILQSGQVMILYILWPVSGIFQFPSFQPERKRSAPRESDVVQFLFLKKTALTLWNSLDDW